MLIGGGWAVGGVGLEWVGKIIYDYTMLLFHDISYKIKLNSSGI